MNNQHKHIRGYRDLSAEDIDLMNRIKQKGRELLELHDEIVARTSNQGNQLWADEQNANTLVNAAQTDETHSAAVLVQERARNALEDFQRAEPFRWAAMGRSDVQKGVMCLVRAVAQPDGAI